MPDCIAHLLDNVRVAQPKTFGSLTMFPLVAGSAAEGIAYLTLDEALATGRFRVTEVSGAGRVPELRVENGLDQPVFLLDGEELVGAKQNRILNLSLMIPARSTVTVPVSCVESGRWHYHGEEFSAAARAQFARGRARKLDQVSSSLRSGAAPMADQWDVWHEISAKSQRMGAWSPTEAMAALFEQNRKAVDEHIEALQAGGDQVGAVFAFGGAAAGLDLFDRPRTYARLARKLVASYAIDAIETGPAPLPAHEVVDALLRAVAEAPAEAFPAPGTGRTLRLSSPALAGAALEVEGRCVHLAAFPREAQADRGAAPREAGMARASQRRRRFA